MAIGACGFGGTKSVVSIFSSADFLSLQAPSIMMPAAISKYSILFIAGAKLRLFFETAKKKPPIHIEDIFSYLFNTFYCLKEPYYLRSETRSSLFKNTMLT